MFYFPNLFFSFQKKWSFRLKSKKNISTRKMMQLLTNTIKYHEGSTTFFCDKRLSKRHVKH